MPEPQREIIANLDRLNQLMDQHALAGLVVRSGKNFTYLAGFAFPGTLARHLDFPDSPREVLLVWPRRGGPVMVLNNFATPLARRDSWVRSIEVYNDYAESPYARVADILKKMGLDRENLGLKKSYLSAARWEEIGGLLPQANLVDCTDLMDRVRWIKTPGEIALLQQGADLLDEAYLEVFPDVRPGDTEREVHSRIIQSCIRGGAQWAHGILNSSRNTVAYGGEGDTEFRSGDIIRNDYVSYYEGYPGHQSRTVVVGEPSPEQRQTYEVMRDIYRATIDQCRVGARNQRHLPVRRRPIQGARLPRPPGSSRTRCRRLVAPAGALYRGHGPSPAGGRHGAGLGAPHRLLALAGHDSGNQRRSEAALNSIQHRSHAGCRLR